MARLHLPVLGQRSVSALTHGARAIATGGLAQPIPGGVARSRDPLVDAFSRRIRYLRVSITDRCNYRCTYCMPEELGTQIEFQPRAELLTFEEIVRLVQIFARLGVRKVRLTGGEPTVRRGVVSLVRQVAAVPGIEQVVMTSNGHLLDELAQPLAEAGLTGLNVSLDTLDPDRFRALTGRGDLARVQAGIAAAAGAGIPLKLNAVALRDVNAGELVALCEYAWSVGAVPRFIEHMPMSGGALYAEAAELPAAQIRVILEAAFGALLPRATAGRDGGPSRYWGLAAHPAREVGIISAMTEHFCDDCNRLRLTAVGALHACLGHDDAVSLRDVIRRGGADADVVAAIASAVTGKRAGHEFERAGGGAPQKHMIGIGG
jgi:cyclic pyranopterin phosphate synthase